MFVKSVTFTLVALLAAGSSFLMANTQSVHALVVQATDTSGTAATTDTSGTAATTSTTATTATFPAPNELVYEVEKRGAPLTVHGNFPDAIKVTVKTKEATPRVVPDLNIRGTIRKGEGAQLYSATKKGDAVVIKTNSAGVASFGILTGGEPDVTVQITPLSADEKTEFASVVEIETLSGKPQFVTSLGSKRSYLQLFMGQTFSMNYQPDPTSTQGENNNTGFSDAGPVIRLTFDTMWKRQKENMEHSIRHGLWHTDANIEFSRFPFGEDEADAVDPNDPIDPDVQTNQVGLKNAFSATLGLTWQPNRFASYDARDPDELLPEDPQPFDAYRWGLFGKMGVTTRAKSEPGGNTSINRIQFGIRFTHGRSDHSNPIDEDRNEVPIRFVEISYGRFSDWGSGHTRQDSASRLVIDGGLRITALSNEVFPVYVGAHVNSGPGEDDLRLFLGVLVKLDVLGRLVQGGVPAPN
jgi:hypothetical protein